MSSVSFTNETETYKKDEILRLTGEAMVKQGHGVGDLRKRTIDEVPNLHENMIRTDFKYIYIHFDNRDPEIDYYETQIFEESEGIELLAPFEH